MTSCQKEVSEVLTLEAERYSSNAKLHLDSENYAAWDNGDKILLNGIEKIVTISDNSATITDVATSSTGYTAYYPSSLLAGGIPSIQTYRVSNGKQVLDAPMTAYCAAGSDKLKFKDLGCILAMNVTNSSTTEAINVRKIVVTDLSGNNSFHGMASVDAANATMTVIGPLGENSHSVTLYCGNCASGSVSVAAGDSKVFYVAMPTISNAKLQIEVFDDYYSYTRTQSSASTTFTRSSGHAVPFATDGAVREQCAPIDYEIWYTTNNGSTVTPNSTWVGVQSNIYHNGHGVITFPEPITSVPAQAFWTGSTLTSITLPPSK